MIKYLKNGEKYGRLTVIKYSHRIKHEYKDSKRNHYDYYYLCKCDCGNIGIFTADHLRSGNTKSCGCISREIILKRNTKHNLSKTRIYKIYHGMKKRCYDKNEKSYPRYGGKGIKICDEWLSDFINFYNWAIAHGYSDTLTIERKDYRGDYTPENCTWIPAEEQARNTSRNVYHEYKGKKKLLGEWAKEYNLPFTCVRKRLVRGWTLEKALNTPKLR